VVLQRRDGGRWRGGDSFHTAKDGAFRRTLDGSGSYRFRWDSEGGSAYSAPVVVR
jgi:hypothetical protein